MGQTSLDDVIMQALVHINMHNRYVQHIPSLPAEPQLHRNLRRLQLQWQRSSGSPLSPAHH